MTTTIPLMWTGLDVKKSRFSFTRCTSVNLIDNNICYKSKFTPGLIVRTSVNEGINLCSHTWRITKKRGNVVLSIQELSRRTIVLIQMKSIWSIFYWNCLSYGCFNLTINILYLIKSLYSFKKIIFFV